MFNDIVTLIWTAYDKFTFLPLFIQIALAFIIIAVAATITSYIVIMFRRYNAYKVDKRMNIMRPQIEEIITDQVLINENLERIPVDEIEFDPATLNNIIFKKAWVRQATIDILISYRKNFRGEVGDLLRKLYIDLGLTKDSFDKLKSLRWERKIKAVVELTQMDIQISDVTILPLTNSTNPALRAAARNAYIQLSKNEPFKFFDIATEPILPWDQMELYKIITTTKDIAVPNFSRWVSYSTNKSVVSFCLKLIAHYDQQSAIPSVMDLLNNKDHYFRADAIACLGKLSAEVAEDRLIRIYNTQPIMCQIEILSTLGKIASGKHLEFLKQEFLYSSNFDIRMNAARAVIAHNTPASRAMIDEMMEETHEENKVIIRHCLNPLLK
ncbi:MAG: HEAT repeat domain-containing protein [Chitinophagia bacterium]|nr:HEAT repeat domain-containing protein [Chitinophagia bacterium]